MRALLDMNVLIALLDSDHLHHTRAMAWPPENNSVGLGVAPADRERLYPDHVTTRPPECTAGRSPSSPT